MKKRVYAVIAIALSLGLVSGLEAYPIELKGDIRLRTQIEDKKNVSISSLVRNKYQPRKKFDEISLEELTNSIRERGIIQPIIVRPSSDEEDKFEIIDA